MVACFGHVSAPTIRGAWEEERTTVASVVLVGRIKLVLATSQVGVSKAKPSGREVSTDLEVLGKATVEGVVRAG